MTVAPRQALHAQRTDLFPQLIVLTVLSLTEATNFAPPKPVWA